MKNLWNHVVSAPSPADEPHRSAHYFAMRLLWGLEKDTSFWRSQLSTLNVQRPTFKSQADILECADTSALSKWRHVAAFQIQLNGSQLPGCGGGFVPLRVR